MGQINISESHKEVKELKKKIRCTQCRKKLGHLTFKCSCGGNFCIQHQSIHSHNCPNLTKKKELIKNDIHTHNPKVIPKTLEHM